MTNTRRKGNLAEMKAVKELEDAGWLAYRVKGSTKWNKNVDIFGLFDILTIKKETLEIGTGYSNQYRKWIQVKHQKPVFKPFEDFYKKYCIYPYDSVEIWVWVKRKGFVKYKTNPEGKLIK